MLLTQWTDFILFIHVSEKFFERKTEHPKLLWSDVLFSLNKD